MSLYSAFLSFEEKIQNKCVFIFPIFVVIKQFLVFFFSIKAIFLRIESPYFKFFFHCLKVERFKKYKL